MLTNGLDTRPGGRYSTNASPPQRWSSERIETTLTNGLDTRPRGRYSTSVPLTNRYAPQGALLDQRSPDPCSPLAHRPG